jgi:hypothetical protein
MDSPSTSSDRADKSDEMEETVPPMPHLGGLPEELISNIADRLDCDDQCSLRLTCRSILAKTLQVFVKEYFSQVRIVSYYLRTPPHSNHTASSLAF